MGGAKEGCVVEYHVKGCDIVCAAEVRRCVGASSVWGAAMNAIGQTRRVAGVGTARRRCISRGKRSVE